MFIKLVDDKTHVHYIIFVVLDIPVVGVKSTSYITQIHKDVVLHCEIQLVVLWSICIGNTII